MLKKMVVRNLYHKKLSFESLLDRPFSMDGKEVRTVDFEMGIALLKSVFIERVDKEPDMEVKMKILDTEIDKTNDGIDVKIRTEAIVKDSDKSKVEEKDYNYKFKSESIVKDKKLTKKGREAIVKD